MVECVDFVLLFAYAYIYFITYILSSVICCGVLFMTQIIHTTYDDAPLSLDMLQTYVYVTVSRSVIVYSDFSGLNGRSDRHSGMYTKASILCEMYISW